MEYLFHDSELMVQHVAATAVPKSSRFITANDENGNIMIFSLGTDKKLHVIKKDKTGNFVVNDLGALLRLTDDYEAYTFDVAQNPDTTLFITLATESKADPVARRLTVLRPFVPKDYDLSLPSTDLRALIIPPSGTHSDKRVWSIYMNGSSKARPYPLVLVAYQPLDQINKEEDLVRVDVNASYKSWSLASDLSLPENATKMLALQPLNLPLGANRSLAGFAALYEIQDRTQLIFNSTEKVGASYYRVGLRCPPDARCLSSSVNSNGFTDLLVGGSGLFHFDAAECVRRDSTGTEITRESVFSAVREIYVSQSPDGLACWAAGTHDGVGYIRSNPAWTNTQAPVPVIPDGQGGNFAPYKAPSEGPEQLVVSDKYGVLSLLQYDPVRRMWNRVPLFTPALDTTIDVSCYTTQITVTGASKLPLANSEVVLRSSGLVDIQVNGRPVTTDLDGAVVRTDQYGMLTLIVPTEDISSYTFTVADPSVTSSPPRAVDPTEKVNEALSKIKTGDDLRNATLQGGGKLLDGTGLSDTEIDAAAKVISQAQTARRRAAPSDDFRTSSNEVFSLGTPVGRNVESLMAVRSSWKNMAWDAWHWFENLVEKVESYFINLLQKGAELVVQIAGTVYRWLLNGLEEIGKALSWVFKKILGVGAKLVEWLGFIFDWKDIQATHLSISHLMNGALDSGAAYVEKMESKVDGFFKDLRQHIKDATSTSRPDKVDSSSASGQSVDESAQETNPSNSAKVNWAQYQLTHGGAVSASVIYEDGEPTADAFDTLWNDVVKPLFGLFENTALDLGKLVLELFKSNDSLSVKSAMAQMGTQMLLDFVDGIRKLAVGLLKVVAALVTDFKQSINYKVTIPVFSSLYKRFISGGEDLTFLDGLSMILAIPVTILHKMATGKSPPDMTNINYGSLIEGQVPKDDLAAFNQFSSVSSLFASAMAGAIDAVSALTETSAGLHATAAVHGHGASSVADVPLAMESGLRVLKLGGAKQIASKYWRDILACCACVATIPVNTELPQYVLRWVSWVICVINRVVAAVLRRVKAAAQVVVEKALAVIEVILGSINYALVITIKTYEFVIPDWPGRNPAWTIIDLMSGTFDVLGTLSAGVGHIAVDPETKLLAEGINFAALALSYSLTGVKVVAKLPLGEYNDIINKVI